MLKIAYHPIYNHPLPEGHRFPMVKYELLPKQLLHEGTCSPENFFEPVTPNDKHIVAVHDPALVCHCNTADAYRQFIPISFLTGFTDGHDDPAPVRIFASNRCFDQR